MKKQGALQGIAFLILLIVALCADMLVESRTGIIAMILMTVCAVALVLLSYCELDIKHKSPTRQKRVCNRCNGGSR